MTKARKIAQKVVLILILLISGFACSSGEIITPNGESGYPIQCMGNKYKCWEQATKKCGGSYELIDDTEDKVHEGTSREEFKLFVVCK